MLGAAQLTAGDLRSARRYLKRALVLAEQEGAIRPFLDEGPPLHARLARCGWSAWLPAIFPSPDKREGPAGEIVELLSERKLEVLRLLATGLTYAEIADRLAISLNTVRFHVKEVYGKLGVNRQAQAVARARELRLL